ncbi:hypothetical protein BRADI_2g50250v3 [Brachypodium distachyon]|uniref:DUF642 domain-containing protein n=1 Tax=Brachypodium distachyon TaxID=15368 RepID=A0A2K2DF24_BRADI|nr:hypothetical protein BRADI_2g50250v3 [Brachypodium distachyon]
MGLTLLGLCLAVLLLAPPSRLASAAAVEDATHLSRRSFPVTCNDNVTVSQKGIKRGNKLGSRPNSTAQPSSVLRKCFNESSRKGQTGYLKDGRGREGPSGPLAVCMGLHGTSVVRWRGLVDVSLSPHRKKHMGGLVRTMTHNEVAYWCRLSRHALRRIYVTYVFSSTVYYALQGMKLTVVHSITVTYSLLSNGDFETAPVGGFAKSASVSEGASTIPSWTINGTVELVSAGQHQGGMILIVPQGDHAVRLGNDAGIGQVVQLESLNVSAGGVSQTVDLQTLYNIEGWDAYALAFQAVDEQANLEFRNPGMEDDPTCGPILDNVAIKKLFAPEKPKDNMVVNGDFEEGPWMFPNTSFGVLLPTNLDEQTSALPGWMIESNRAVRFVDSDQYTVPQGKRAIELLSGKEGIISQMVETTPQKVYSLTFTLGSAGDSCQPPMAVMAFAGDQAQNFHYSPMGNATSQAANVTFTARAERTRVALYSVYYNTRSDDHSSLCGPVIDDVRVWGLNGAAGLKASIGLLLGMVSVIGLMLF